MENLNEVIKSLKENLINIKAQDLLGNWEGTRKYLLEGMELWLGLNKELKNRHLNSLTWQQMILDDLIVGGVTVESCYERIEEIIDSLESIIKEYNRDDIKLGEQLYYKNILVVPLDSLISIYVYKHKGFKCSLEQFHNDGHTKEFLWIFR